MSKKDIIEDGWVNMADVDDLIKYFVDNTRFTEEDIKKTPHTIYKAMLEDYVYSKALAYDMFIDLVRNDDLLSDCLNDGLKELIRNITRSDEDIKKFNKILISYRNNGR